MPVGPPPASAADARSRPPDGVACPAWGERGRNRRTACAVREVENSCRCAEPQLAASLPVAVIAHCRIDDGAIDARRRTSEAPPSEEASARAEQRRSNHRCRRSGHGQHERPRSGGGGRRPADGTAQFERKAGRVIARSEFNGNGADAEPSDRRLDARQSSTFVPDVCQLGNKLVPIAAKPRFRPVHASTL